jgi:transposase
MNLVSTLGIDLAKSSFSLHGVNSNGEVVLRRTLSRAKLSELVAQLPPCLIGMEACSGAHEWARRFASFGHTVKLMAAKFVTPYRKSGKNDGNDAEAICEAVARPNMRFVPVKSLEQQSGLTLHGAPGVCRGDPIVARELLQFCRITFPRHSTPCRANTPGRWCGH